MLPIGLTLVVFGIAIAYGLNVMGDVQDDIDDMHADVAGCNSTSHTACTDDYNASQDAIDGVAKLPEKLPLIATVIVAALIIGILVRYLMVRFG